MRFALFATALVAVTQAVRLDTQEQTLAQVEGFGVMSAAGALGAGSLDKVAADSIDMMASSIHDAKKATSEAAMNAVDGLSSSGAIASNAVQAAGAIDSKAVGTAASLATNAINKAALKTSNDVAKSAGNAVKQLNTSADSIVETLNTTAQSASKMAKA